MTGHRGDGLAGYTGIRFFHLRKTNEILIYFYFALLVKGISVTFCVVANSINFNFV